MSENLIIWAVATVFYTVAAALAAYVGWMAAGAVGAILTVVAAAGAAAWVVAGKAA